MTALGYVCSVPDCAEAARWGVHLRAWEIMAAQTPENVKELAFSFLACDAHKESLTTADIMSDQDWLQINSYLMGEQMPALDPARAQLAWTHLPVCEVAACENVAVYLPVITAWPPSVPKIPENHFVAQISLGICPACKETVSLGELIDEATWDHIHQALAENHKTAIDPATAELSWIPIGGNASQSVH